MDQTCRHQVVCVLGRGPVYSGCSLSFPSARELCSRDKSPAAPYTPPSSLPRAWAEEPRMSYKSPFRNLNLIMHHFLNFPRTEFSYIYPGHKSTSLHPFLNCQAGKMAWKVTCHFFYLLPHFLRKQNGFKTGYKDTTISLGDHDLISSHMKKPVSYHPGFYMLSLLMTIQVVHIINHFTF